LTVEPSQFSVASHSPAEERQTTNAPDTLSLGQGWSATPVQLSATSQTPAAERQTVLDEATVSDGQG
jgi:hypothetical protein